MTWPNEATKQHLDQDADDPKQARGELASLIEKFNQLRNHVSSFMRGVLARTDAAGARADLEALHNNVSATDRFLGRRSAGAGPVEELTGAQATARLNTFTAGAKGLVPAPGTVTGEKALLDDGTFGSIASGPTLTAEVDLTNGGLNDLATVELVTGLPSGVVEISVVMHGWRVDGNTDVVIQFGTSGGWVTTGYVSATRKEGGGTASVTNGLAVKTRNPNDDLNYTSYTIRKVGSNTNKWLGRGITHDATGDVHMENGAGGIDLGGEVTRVRVFSGSSFTDFDAGSAAVQYQ